MENKNSDHVPEKKFDNAYFRTARDSGNATVDIVFQHRDFSAADFPALNRMDFAFCKGYAVTFSGPAPLWLYMFCAIRAWNCGADAIRVSQAQENSTVTVYPIPAIGISCPPQSGENFQQKNFNVLEYNSHGVINFTKEQLPDLLHYVPEAFPGKNLILTGSMPNFLAAASALRARFKKWNFISYWTPRNPAIYQLWPEIKEIPPIFPPATGNRLIGIVGDPNSGKSVFSSLLEQAGRKAGWKIWKYDCDYAAPTPNWYLRILHESPDNPAYGQQIRNEIKRKWTSNAEKSIAVDLANLKKYYPMVIADLPGGIHPKDKGPAEAQRIPPGREVMLKEIDHFIIIARHDRESDKYWHQELTKHQLDHRVILTAWSEEPDAPLEIQIQNPHTITLRGLSRNGGNAPDEFLRALWKAVSSNFD